MLHRSLFHFKIIGDSTTQTFLGMGKYKLSLFTEFGAKRPLLFQKILSDPNCFKIKSTSVDSVKLYSYIVQSELKFIIALSLVKVLNSIPEYYFFDILLMLVSLFLRPDL
ncbi:hypothetical protein BD749_3825 [Pontibacter ramchanderi]|uniref:Uncharacterized protein n=1 Tax=Pontibacter ramchanderi TaxID=1179743 RepID=A0A2N3U6P6_9BACT|nr:hypothetical protein BD749_3825 [Pontibacter ramchanderi]